MTQPINLIFRFLQSKARIQIWLFEQKDLRIEGRIIGFDEYMNLVLDDAEEEVSCDLSSGGLPFSAVVFHFWGQLYLSAGSWMLVSFRGLVLFTLPRA